MKATINGVICEGTPAEIAEYTILTTAEVTGSIGSIEIKDVTDHMDKVDEAMKRLLNHKPYVYTPIKENAQDKQNIMGMGEVIGQTKKE